MRPYRCIQCDEVFYAEEGAATPYHGRKLGYSPAGEDGNAPLQWEFCPGTGLFVGFSDEEMGRMNSRELGTTLTVHLNEQSVWEERGMLNPHSIPLKGSAQLEEWKRQGRVVKDDKGRDCLLSKNKQEWKASMKELGYTTGDD